MNAIKSAISAYMNVHEKVAWPIGTGLVVVLIGIAVYARWIQPEAEFDKITSSMPAVVNWGLVVIICLLLPPVLWHFLQMAFLVVLSVFAWVWVAAPLAFLGWIFGTIRDALRKRRSP